jgi:hypothetical protein
MGQKLGSNNNDIRFDNRKMNSVRNSRLNISSSLCPTQKTNR